MKRICDLTDSDREKILQEAGKHCYIELAEEMNTTVGTIKKVLRNHNNRLKRYQLR